MFRSLLVNAKTNLQPVQLKDEHSLVCSSSHEEIYQICSSPQSIQIRCILIKILFLIFTKNRNVLKYQNVKNESLSQLLQIQPW